MKYNFYNLRMDCPQKGKDLPEDVNAKIESRVKMFKSATLMKMLDDVRKKKFYGDGFYIKSSVVMAKFNFQHGICYQMKIVRDYGAQSIKELIESDGAENVLFETNIKNEDIDMRRVNGNKINLKIHKEEEVLSGTH